MSVRKRAPSKKTRRIAPGLSFEQAVAKIQQAIDPNSQVEHNVLLPDRVGNERQYDVIVRGHFAGRPILGVIECKDHGRRKGPDAVEAFAKKTENLGANLRVIVSRSGFTEQALRLAQHEHIACYSLLPKPATKARFSIGDYIYGIRSQWEPLALSLVLTQPVSNPPIFRPDEVTWDQKSVHTWFKREFLKKHADETEPGTYRLTFRFHSPTSLQIGASSYSAVAVFCLAKRVYQRKRQWFHWTGQGFMDWHIKQITFPGKEAISSTAVSTDLSTWPDYHGEIPGESGSLGDMKNRQLILVMRDVQTWSDEENHLVPDLSPLGMVTYERENA